MLALCSVARADDVRFHYDRSGNIVAIQQASATALAVEDVRPGFGASGDTVTIVGAGFGITASANTVTFNGAAASVIAPSSNALTVTVPANATSGPVSVTVGSASAQSSQNFIILPSGVTSASVSNAMDMTLDGSARDVATVGSRNVILSFTLPQAKYASLHLSNFLGDNTSGVAYTVYKPDGTQSASGTVGIGAPDVLLPAAQTAGLYTVYLKPQGWLKAHVTLTSDPQLVVNGPAWAFTSVPAGRQVRQWFSATTGQNLSAGITNFSLGPTSASYPTYTWYQPNGNTLGSLLNLPTTGAYAVTIGTAANATSTSLQLWLNSDLTGAFQLNTATPLSATRPAQHARYTFQGTQGDHIRFGTTATTMSGNGRLATYVYDPNGASIISGGYFNSTPSSNSTASATLAVTGTYTVLIQVNPYDDQNETWGTTFAVSKDVDATITIDGPSTAVSTSVVGQEIRATFSGTAGQNLSFGYSNVTISPAWAGGPTIQAYTPDGTALSSWSNLPQTGTYTIVVTPTDQTTTLNMQLWLSTDLTGVLSLNTATSISARVGQHARYTFQGTQGDHIRFGTTATTISGNGRLATYVYDPNGATILSGGNFNSTPGSNSTASATLSVTGTYTVVMQINYYDDQNESWSTTFAVSKDVDATITIDGSSTTASTTVVGQEIRGTFAATAGQNLTFGISNFSYTPSGGGGLTTSVYKPDGSTLGSWSNLPQTGTYTMVLTPSDPTLTTSMQLWLSTEATGALALNTATSLSVSRPGQHGRYTFQGTQGQVVTFTATNTSTSPAYQRVAIYAYNPDGTGLISGGFFNTNAYSTDTYTTGALPTTGTYTVFIAINPYDNSNATWATTLTVAPH
jgi:hypothetical protein